MARDEVLVVGGESAGKSVFIRRLKEFVHRDQLDECDRLVIFEGTLPTVGVELNTIALRNGRDIDLREVGSALSSRWENYLEDCKGMIFVVDVSDIANVATSLVLLHELLAAYHLMADKPILLALNKTDLTDNENVAQVSNALRIDELKAHYTLEVIQGSAMDDSLCRGAMDWINKW